MMPSGKIGKQYMQVVRNIEIIREASKYIPEDIKTKYQHIDWKGIVGFRNRITHEYFDVSINIIWHIIENELPLLKNQIASILEKEKK